MSKGWSNMYCDRLFTDEKRTDPLDTSYSPESLMLLATPTSIDRGRAV